MSEKEAPVFQHDLDAETTLRPVEVRHADELFALADANRAALRQWLPWVDDTRAPDDTRGFIEGALRQYAADNGFQAGIWHAGRIAGMIGFHYFDRHNRKTEIGYWLGAAFQGKGIMTRACQAMIDHAFSEQRLNRIEIKCASGNARSRAIPQRLGFQQDGVLRQDSWLYDHYVDQVVYSLLASEWPTREGANRG
jgi:ribosomal-protein-serine acetyltransferase